MKLYIDTSSSEKITVKMGDQEFEEPARVNKSQRLLPLIIDKLEVQEKTLKDITEIEVNVGPGSFTGLRVGVAVGNALAWALNIPINSSKKLVEPVY
jgi:tRNA threonylcarbamoyladenosine biosynthesis protein TsaB